MKRLTILMCLAGLFLTCHARTFEEIQKELLKEQFNLTNCQVEIAKAENWIALNKLFNAEGSSEEAKKKRLADIASLLKGIENEKACAAALKKRIDDLLKELDALPNPAGTQVPERQKGRAIGADVRAKLDAIAKRHLKAESDLRALSKNVRSTSDDRKAGKK
jgi:hypothetical protein